MALTEKPSGWRFELETPEFGNPDARSFLSSERKDLESLLFNGQIFDFKRPLTVRAEAKWAEDDLAVTIQIHTLLSSSCSRCLEPSDIEIMNDFLYLYSLRKKAVPNGDSEEEDYHVVPISRWTRGFDISDQVWESLILSLPIRVLCSEKCRGLCPFCGKSLNEGDCGCSSREVDPRLEKLLGMEIKDSSE